MRYTQWGPSPGCGADATRSLSVGRRVGTLLEDNHEVLATDGDTAVVHWNVVLQLTHRRLEEDGLLVLMFAADGRCREHREWFVEREPPGKPETSPG